ncbi:MAG: YjbH domain-containing protein [Bacteroidetes bacterium]|nr:YjbH domain-containing protein [Bacteroidota bacterium]
MFSKTLLFFGAMALPFAALRGQAPAVGHSEAVAGELVKAGYENVRVLRKSDTLFIGLENRVYRWEPRAAADVLKRVMPGTDSAAIVSLTLLRTGIPVTTVIVSRRQYDNLLAGRVSAAGFSDSVAALLSDRGYRGAAGRLRPLNPSFNKFDVVVAPQVKLQLGNFVHPLEVQFNVAPAVNISFRRGMSLTAQVIFPVFNNIIGDPEGNTIRPGLVVLSQAFRLPFQFFTTVSAGYFTRNRYGVNGELRKFLLNGKVSLGGTLGYTGMLQLVHDEFNYSSIGLVTWFCDASWRYAPYDLTLRAGYGGFIGRDEGLRVDVSRRFGEVSIGFFAMRTAGVMNGGFNFIVPLPPRRLGTKNRIRIRPAPYLPWEYRAKGLPSMGRTFSTGSGTDELLFNLNPDDIRKQLGKQILNY